jgi:hypothetical protein
LKLNEELFYQFSTTYSYQHRWSSDYQVVSILAGRHSITIRYYNDFNNFQWSMYSHSNWTNNCSICSPSHTCIWIGEVTSTELLVSELTSSNSYVDRWNNNYQLLVSSWTTYMYKIIWKFSFHGPLILAFTFKWTEQL